MMNQQRFNDGVIDLSQFRKQKEEKQEEIQPLFTEPTLITLGEGDQEVKYMLIVNLVLNNKQYLALESTETGEEGQIAIVEAIVENDQLAGVQVVQTEEEYEEVIGIITEALEQQAIAQIQKEGEDE